MIDPTMFTPQKWLKRLVLLALAARVIKPGETFEIHETWDGFIAIGRKQHG